jgi:hypothetical protein
MKTIHKVAIPLTLSIIAILVVALAPVALVASVASAASAAQPAHNSAAIPFGTHITMGLPEQDVFIRHDGTPQDQVFRVSVDDAKKDAVLDQPVYASSSMQPHDPFAVGGNPMGPYPIGKPLGFTLRQWLSGGGEVTYDCVNGQSTVRGSVRNVVPNGQYTVWYTRLTFPPNLKVVDQPLGAADGSQNSFKADASGNGSFAVTFAGCLEPTHKETATLIVTAYHSDGQTFGPKPGDFGSFTHVQNIAVVPPPSAPAGADPGMPKTGAAEPTWPGVILALVLALTSLLVGMKLVRKPRDA